MLLIPLLSSLLLVINAEPLVDRECAGDLSNLWLDVVAVVDNSNGMPDEAFSTIAANILTIFSQSKIGISHTEPRTTRVGLVTYNEDATIRATLDDFSSTQNFTRSIFASIGKSSSNEQSFVAHGLAKAEEIFRQGASSRKNYKKVVVVYASAYKGEGLSNPVPVANRLKTSGVTIITVAYNQKTDSALLSGLADIASPGHSVSNTDKDIISGIQHLLLQANCFCPNDWTQHRQQFSSISSHRFGVCLRAVGLPASWLAAQAACHNQRPGAYLAGEYSVQKHEYLFEMVANSTGFSHPLAYHIGLLKSEGVWQWDRPDGKPQVAVQNDLWRSGLRASAEFGMNTEYSNGASAWTPVGATTSANYVCEVVSCDTDNYCL